MPLTMTSTPKISITVPITPIQSPTVASNPAMDGVSSGIPYHPRSLLDSLDRQGRSDSIRNHDGCATLPSEILHGAGLYSQALWSSVLLARGDGQPAV